MALPTAQLKFTPGTQAWYSNIGYDLLSDALANAAHTSYPALLGRAHSKPLGMWETTFYPNDAQCAQLMRGPHNEGRARPPRIPTAAAVSIPHPPTWQSGCAT